MRDLFIVCMDGHLNSIIGALAVGMEAKQAGQDVAVFFVQGPLATLAERKFELSDELKGYEDKIARNLEKQGFSADPLQMLKMAKAAGVPLLGCGAWSGLLEVADKLPEEITVVDPATCIRETLEAKKTMTMA